MKRNLQFNEPQACQTSMLFYKGECYGKENNLFSCTSWIWRKNQLCQKKNIYESNDQD